MGETGVQGRIRESHIFEWEFEATISIRPEIMHVTLHHIALYVQMQNFKVLLNIRLKFPMARRRTWITKDGPYISAPEWPKALGSRQLLGALNFNVIGFSNLEQSDWSLIHVTELINIQHQLNVYDYTLFLFINEYKFVNNAIIFMSHIYWLSCNHADGRPTGCVWRRPPAGTDDSRDNR